MMNFPDSCSRRVVLAGWVGLAALSPACQGDDDGADERTTIADLIAEDDRLESLELALEHVNLMALLGGDEPFTVFAPIDAAFDDVLAARGSSRQQLSVLPDLGDRMRYHIVRGDFARDALRGDDTLTAFQGDEITLERRDDQLVLNRHATIVHTQLRAANGTIHILDTVMIPPHELFTEEYRSSPALELGPRATASDTISIADIGHVVDLEVVLDIDNQLVWDLAVTLEHTAGDGEFRFTRSGPVAQHDAGGTAVFNLVRHPQSVLPGIKVTLSDSAIHDVQDDVVETGPFPSSPYPEGRYRPFEPLALAYGTSLEGEWTLRLDTLGISDQSTILNSWGLNVTYTVEDPEPGLALVPSREPPAVLARGFRESARVKVKRLAGFAADIELSLDGGEGVSAEPMVLRDGAEDVTMIYGAANDAALGERSLTFTARGVRSESISQRRGTVVAPDVNNVTFLAHMPLAALGAPSGDGNDIWGWTDPTSGVEYALVGTSVGTAFVDISRPTAPVYLGMLPTHTHESPWRDIKVFQDHAFIVSEADDHGMQVFDLAQLRGVTSPRVFEETAHYGGFGNAHNIVINEASGFAYAVGATDRDYPEVCSGGLFMIDINDPRAPGFAGCFGGGVPPGQDPGPEYPADVYIHDAQCVMYRGPDPDYQGREICLTSDGQVDQASEDYLGVADVTDKSAPIQIARATYEGSGYAHQGWLTEDHSYFLLNDELDELAPDSKTRTYIWDVRDLDAPRVIGVFDNPRDAIGHNTFVKGNRAYQANYTSGLRVVDISDIGNAGAREIAFFDSFPDDDADNPSELSGLDLSIARCSASGAAAPAPGPGVLHHPDDGNGCAQAAFRGAWSNYPFFDSGVILISDIDRGLFIVRMAEN